jgi:hypothetical protein
MVRSAMALTWGYLAPKAPNMRLLRVSYVAAALEALDATAGLAQAVDHVHAGEPAPTTTTTTSTVRSLAHGPEPSWAWFGRPTHCL